MNESADSTLRAEIEDEFRQFDPDLGLAAYRLYQASWILRKKLPNLAALPAAAIDEIRRAMGTAADERDDLLSRENIMVGNFDRRQGRSRVA
jgi:hypothetical protein